MTQVTHDDIVRLARLSKIKLGDAEIDSLTNDLNNIVSYVDKLSEVDTNGAQPTDQVTGLTNVMRADEVIDYGADQAGLMRNVVDSQDDHIKVPRALAR